MSTATYNGATYSRAPAEYVCNACGHREALGRTNNMGTPEGSVPMLRHLQAAHGYQPKTPIRDWQERVERSAQGDGGASTA